MPKMRGFSKGITLIEVLVSLVIFVAALLAILQLFDTSHATYASGTRKQDVQQQARLAMDGMVRALRMAGYVPENYDADPTNDLVNTARIHVATPAALAVFGSMDGTNQSAAFLFCRSGTTLVSKRDVNTGDPATYTCNNAEVIAENLTQLSFTYFDEAGAQLAGNLDGKNVGAALDLAPRVQRDAVRTIVVTLQITEPVPRAQAQVYNLTSTVRLRNLNNL